ncbi:MAG: SAM-dependent methyltransferase [Bacteroidetes bacterium]|nr:MAG: SAM-dependent methyltransferase [Bacteroidota bacterium]
MGKQNMEKGKLYLIPTPLGDEGAFVLPAYVIQTLGDLRFLIAEKAKTARHFIKKVCPDTPLPELTIFELNKRTDPAEWRSFLAPALAGNSMGVLSEAGCPGVADPGAAVVQIAHELGIEVVPMVGPSSILLALMGSGLNGQNFAFRGYLPAKRPELARELKRLEQLVVKRRQTQIFIETPYRSQSFFEVALQALSPKTRLCIAADLTLPTQFIQTKAVSGWRRTDAPPLHKRPTVFLIG